MQGSRIGEHDGGHLNFINKAIYYLTDLHSSQKSRKVAYDKLVRTYQITFTKHTVFPKHKDYLTQGCLRSVSGLLISDQLNIAIIELSKLKPVLQKPIDDLTSLDMWSAFLGYASDPKRRDFINKMIEKKGELAMATSILMNISQDDRERARFRSKRKFETDHYSDMDNAERKGRAEGIAQGITQGMTQGIVQVARNMKTEGMPIENIARLTNLSIDEVRKL